MTDKTKISILKCADYDEMKIGAAIDQTFAYFGGIQKFAKSGAKVLIKPNFIKKSLSEECAITHPEVIKAVAIKLLEIGAVPIIGDSPAFGTASNIAKYIGLDKFAKMNNIDIVELDKPRKVDMRCGTKLFSHTVSGKALDVDAIINVPKLKAHMQLLFTASVKNMYGCVSGKQKVWRHFKSDGDIGWYTEMLLANYLVVKPIFTIVDAVMSMEERGPVGGVPKQTSLIIGGIDCVAIDRVIAEIINVDSSDVPILRTAKIHNIGEQDMKKIEIVGEPLKSIKIMTYKLPRRLAPIEFNIFRVIRSVIKHLWIKKFRNAV